MEVVNWLNTNSGAVIAALTLVYVVFTGALLLEARSSRLEKLSASVEAYPMVHEIAHLYLAGRIENGGPAYARDISWDVRLLENGQLVDEDRSYKQPLMAPGRHRTTMLHPRGKQATLKALADRGFTVEMTWSWTDGRHRFGVGPRKRHQRSEVWDFATLRDGFYKGSVMVETPVDVKLANALDPIRKAADEIPRIGSELRLLRYFIESRIDHDGLEQPESASMPLMAGSDDPAAE
jgi:hypothetical protein